MFKRSILLFLAFVSVCAFSSAYAKDEPQMTPPKPINNKVLDSMVGTWKGESDMMGEKMNDTIKISWSLNHQFLEMELHSKAANNPNNHYEGRGIFGIDQNGKVKAWWFDSWGAPAVATGEGDFQNNQLVINDSNPMFKEERSFQVTGNQMLMHAKGSMNMNGKETPFDQSVTYRR